MTSSLHESLSREDKIEGPTDRAFGLTVGGILLAIAVLRAGRHLWTGAMPVLGPSIYALAAVGGLLLLLGLVAPATLRWPNRGWTVLGLLLFRIVNPLVLGLIYAVTIVPIGLVIKARGGDPLQRKFDPAAHSYWILRNPPGPAADSMPRQF